MKLRTKLLLAQLPLVLALLLIGALAVNTVRRLGTGAQTILKDNYQSVLAMQTIKESLERMDSASLFKLSGHWNEGVSLVRDNRPVIDKAVAFEENNITERGETEAAKRLSAKWMEYQKAYEQFIATADRDAAVSFYFATLYPLFRQTKQAADEILMMNQDAMERKSSGVRRTADYLNSFMIGSTLLAALLGILISGSMTRRLLRPLTILTQAVRRLGEGDLAARASVIGQDEIAHLAGEFNVMAEHLEKYRRSTLGELLLFQSQTQAAIDSLPDPVVVFDLNGNIINVNAASEQLLGLHATQESLERLPGNLRHKLEEVRAYVLSGKGAWMPKSFDEAISVPSSNGDRWLLARANPLYGEEEGIRGATVLLQDVTRLHRFDELKSDLVSTVAHELRTPLTSLHMAIHLCLDQTVGELNDKQADLLYAAREDCQRLQTMVDDLLDLSRIQSGRIEMKLQTISARNLLETAVSIFKAAAQEKGLQLEIDLSPSIDATVQADPERLQLVLTNLITNAIRHTPSGGTITLRSLRRDNDIRFEVSDTGEGIAPEYQERVFDRFFRVPDASSTGVGLGLSICREIIHAHGGDIGLQSQPARGSTFWFSLPACA